MHYSSLKTGRACIQKSPCESGHRIHGHGQKKSRISPPTTVTRDTPRAHKTRTAVGGVPGMDGGKSLRLSCRAAAETSVLN